MITLVLVLQHSIENWSVSLGMLIVAVVLCHQYGLPDRISDIALMENGNECMSKNCYILNIQL